MMIRTGRKDDNVKTNSKPRQYTDGSAYLQTPAAVSSETFLIGTHWTGGHCNMEPKSPWTW
jgi:hypothetical protein